MNHPQNAYEGGRFDARGRGWLGFSKRTITEAETGAVTAITFDNTTTRKGPAFNYDAHDPSFQYWYPYAQLPQTIDSGVMLESGRVARSSAGSERIPGLDTGSAATPAGGR